MEKLIPNTSAKKTDERSVSGRFFIKGRVNGFHKRPGEEITTISPVTEEVIRKVRDTCNNGISPEHQQSIHLKLSDGTPLIIQFTKIKLQ